MSRLRALRAVPLVLLCLLTAVPGLQAADWGAGRVPASPVSRSSFAGVWDWLRAAVGLLGPEMDPDGANGDLGPEMDPNGAQGDLGHDIDPDG
jgi:hypothetical protein